MKTAMKKEWAAIGFLGFLLAIAANASLLRAESPGGLQAPSVGTFSLGANETIALIGESNLERTRFYPYLQTRLLATVDAKPLHVRNLAWEGDTAFEQWRDINFPTIRQQLEMIHATVAIAQFGQMEALGGEENRQAFIEAYDRLIHELARPGQRIVLVSPMPFEKPAGAHMPDLSKRNGDVRRYADSIKELAARLGCYFVDLVGPLSDQPAGAEALTTDGIHLNDHGQSIVAQAIVKQLGLSQPAEIPPHLQEAALEYERLWFNFARPSNWAFLGGDRMTVAFSHDWHDSKKRIFPEEMQEYVEVLADAEGNIANALEGKELEPTKVRSPIPVEPPSQKPLTPEEELATLKVDPSYRVNLFASEADGVGKVVQIRWDERGRLWALCIPDYPQVKPGAKPRCKLVICEDTKGAGRADRFTVFADGLDMPMGFELTADGAYIAQGPELWRYRDTKGTGHADQREIVLGGFGTGDTHQEINSLSWGFGGELWFTQGHSIYSRVESQYGIEHHERSGAWRYRPRTGRLDTFFQNSTAGENSWGVLVDNYNDVFLKEAANKGGYYALPGMIRSGLPLPGRDLQLFFSRAVKTDGIDLVATRQFPDELQGAVIIGGDYDNTLQIHTLKYIDGKFVSQQLPNIIDTTNRAFRPVDVRFGPDGAVYIADWCNPIVGHYQASYRHPDRDTTDGRIWRITRADRPLVKPAAIATATIPELLEQLDSPERWAKYQAKRLLFEKPTVDVTAALDRWVSELDAKSPATPYRELQALSVYEAHEVVRPELLKALLRDSDFRIRAAATRTLSTWAREGRLPGARELLAAQIADVNPRVRLEAVVAASYFPDPDIVTVAARVLDQPMDVYSSQALRKTLDALKPTWSPMLANGSLHFDKDEHLLFALQQGGFTNAVDLIRAEAEKHKAEPAKAALWLAALAEAGGPEDVQFAFERGGDNAEVLDALIAAAGFRNNMLPTTDNAPALAKLVDNAQSPLRIRAIRLAGLWNAKSLASGIETMAADDSAALDLRKAAMLAVAQMHADGSVQSLLRLADQSNRPEVQLAALEALAIASPSEAAKIAVARLSTISKTDDAIPLLQIICARAGARAALADALRHDNALPQAQARIAFFALNQLGMNDRTFSPLLMKLAGIPAEAPTYTKEFVQDIVQRAQRTGDAATGRKIFEQRGCIACHTIDGIGGKIGPELSAISRALPIDMIATKVVWPSLTVKEGYEAATIALRDGTVLQGFKQVETADEIAIRDINTGVVTRYKRSQLAKVKIGGTVMPDGIVAGLTSDQLADLVRYLSERGK